MVNSSYPSLAANMGTSAAVVTASANLVWSPNATTTSVAGHVDWTNGYGVSGLPSSGLIRLVQTSNHLVSRFFFFFFLAEALTKTPFLERGRGFFYSNVRPCHVRPATLNIDRVEVFVRMLGMKKKILFIIFVLIIVSGLGFFFIKN